ncbi:MAG: NADH-quinone oxidoreductase subunit NuoN [Candidatus Pelagibacterales bacterium]
MSIFTIILPEIFLFLSSTFLLMVGLFYKKINIINLLTFLILILTAVLVIYQPSSFGFNNSFVNDEFSKTIKVLILIGSASTLLMFSPSRRKINIDIYEFPILISFASLGMMVMVSSNDLLAMFIGLELQSLSLYVLASLNRNSLQSSESGISYFILGALSSGLLLFGISYIYGFTGNTNFSLISATYDKDSLGLLIGIVFVCSGLAFKVSAVPFHMWTPDVYQGAPTPVTGFFALAPKVAAVALFLRFLYSSFGETAADWQQIIIFLSIASMIFASFAAIAQSNIKRLMAYSSIGHIGYILIGMACFNFEGVQSLIIYLIIYLVMNISVFSFILMMKRKDEYCENINDLSGLYKHNPFYAILIALSMFSLAGIPPLAGFFGKFYIFMSAIKSDFYLLAVVGIVASVVSAFYYLRIVKIIYFDEPSVKFDEFNSSSLNLLFFISSGIVILFFVYPSPILNIGNYAAKTFF